MAGTPSNQHSGSTASQTMLSQGEHMVSSGGISLVPAGTGQLTTRALSPACDEPATAKQSRCNSSSCRLVSPKESCNAAYEKLPRSGLGQWHGRRVKGKSDATRVRGESTWCPASRFTRANGPESAWIPSLGSCLRANIRLDPRLAMPINARSEKNSRPIHAQKSSPCVSQNRR
ncbi:hypothetical protein VTK26DRAFT_6498 [Humicola hyalothermophila]